MIALLLGAVALSGPILAAPPAERDTTVPKRIEIEAEAARDELRYRSKRAQRALERAKLSKEELMEAQQILDRQLEKVEAEIRKIETSKTVEQARNRLEKCSRKAEQASDQIERAARKKSEQMEDGLEDAAEELEELSETLSDAGENLADKVKTTAKATKKTVEHHVRVRTEKVRLAGDVTVDKDEHSGDVVTMGGTIRVYGHVDGDVVSVGGDVIVFEGGEVDGDAVAVGGTVRVDSGGVVKGEKVSVSGINISVRTEKD